MSQDKQDTTSTAVQVFDIRQFETVDSGSFNALDPKGDELTINGQPVVFHMHGQGTKIQVAAERKKVKAAKAVLYAGIGGRIAKNAEQEEFEREAEYLAACTIRIDNFPVPPLQLYMNHKLNYLTKQAQKYLGDDANFMNSSVQG